MKIVEHSSMKTDEQNIQYMFSCGSYEVPVGYPSGFDVIFKSFFAPPPRSAAEPFFVGDRNFRDAAGDVSYLCADPPAGGAATAGAGGDGHLKNVFFYQLYFPFLLNHMCLLSQE